MNIRYVVNGIPTSSFLGLVELRGKDGDSLYIAISKALKDLGIYNKITSICSDGDPALTGSKKGAITKLKDDLKGLLSLHCLSHRLNLCVTTLWKGDRVLKEINQFVYNLCKLFGKSGNKFKLLKENENSMLELDLNLIKPIDIRWMSKFNAIKRILLLYPAIVRTLSELMKQKDACAGGLYFQMKKFRYVAYLAILSDISFIIEPLNPILQKKNLDFEQAEASITLAKFKLEELIGEGKIGKCLTSLIQDIENTQAFQRIKLIVGRDDIDYVKKRSRDLFKFTLDTIQTRLGSISEFIPLNIFNLERIRKLKINSSLFKSYGEIELKKLIKRFNLNEARASDAWLQLKRLAYAYFEKKTDEFYGLILRITEMDPIKILIETFLSFSFSSNECERTFSRYNLIKTKIRSALKVNTVNDLLMIGLNGPQIEDFSFMEAIESWKLSRLRYFVENSNV